MASSPVAPSQTSLPDLTLKALPASSLPTGSNDLVETFLQSYLDAAQSLLASFDSSEGWKKGGSHVDGTVESFTRPKQEHPHVPVKGKHQANVVGRGDFWCARRSVHKESYEDFSVSFSSPLQSLVPEKGLDEGGERLKLTRARPPFLLSAISRLDYSQTTPSTNQNTSPPLPTPFSFNLSHFTPLPLLLARLQHPLPFLPTFTDCTIPFLVLSQRVPLSCSSFKSRQRKGRSLSTSRCQ
jgi:hypothetical protein